MSTEQDDDAARVAAGMSFNYNFAHFLILRIGLLAGHPIEAHELAALEYGVQEGLGKLKDEVESLKEALAAEEAKTQQYERGSCRVQAELAVQLAVSQSNERTQEQMLDKAHAKLRSMDQQLRELQYMLAQSQQAQAAAEELVEDLQMQLHELKQQQDEQKQEQQRLAPEQQQQAQAQQQEHRQQQAEVAASTPVTSKPQMPLLPLEQPPDAADADTMRQPDQRTPQALQEPQQLLQDAAQHGQPSPAKHGAPLRSPAVRHAASPLLSPSPMIGTAPSWPDALRRSGRESPLTLTPRVASRIPGAPDAAAAAGASSLSYAAALRRPQGALEAAAVAGSAAVGRAPASGSSGTAGSKLSLFKFDATPLLSATAVTGTSMQRHTGQVYKPPTFTAGKVATTTTTGRFGSSGSGSGSTSSRLRRAVRSGQGPHSNRQAKVQPPVQRGASKLPKSLPESDARADAGAERSKKRWR